MRPMARASAKMSITSQPRRFGATTAAAVGAAVPPLTGTAATGPAGVGVARAAGTACGARCGAGSGASDGAGASADVIASAASVRPFLFFRLAKVVTPPSPRAARPAALPQSIASAGPGRQAASHQPQVEQAVDLPPGPAQAR